jgi:hypothetical protein
MNLPNSSNLEGASGGSLFATTSQLKKANKDTPFSELKMGLEPSNLPTTSQQPSCRSNLPTSHPIYRVVEVWRLVTEAG